MSAKNLDKHDRFRCITVGFRVSPEEHETINRIVALSGLTKQEYCYRKCTDREIIVEGNPRVYKALKVELAAVLDELKRIESGGNVSGDLLEVIDQINKTLYGYSAAGKLTICLNKQGQIKVTGVMNAQDKITRRTTQ